MRLSDPVFSKILINDRYETLRGGRPPRRRVGVPRQN